MCHCETDNGLEFTGFFDRQARTGRQAASQLCNRLHSRPGTDPTAARKKARSSSEISGIPAPGFSSTQALDALEQVAKETMPPGMGYDWSNLSYQEKKAAGQGAVVFAFAMLLVFLILAAQYESWSLPFSILLTVPIAVLGAFSAEGTPGKLQ